MQNHLVFSLEIRLTNTQMSNLADRPHGYDIAMYEPAAKEANRIDFLLFKYLSHFSCCVEIGGMWKQLVFPRNISTSTQCEPI